MKKHRFNDSHEVYREGLFTRLFNALASGKDDAVGAGPVFDQLEQRVLFSANPLSEMWSPDDQGGYANAVVAMPLDVGESGLAITGAANPVIESITANKEVLQTFELIQFTINTGDNAAIARYAFSLNGKLVTTGKTMSQNFTEAGTYVLTAVAYDKAGNASETFTKTITVIERPDLRPPGIGTTVSNGAYLKDNFSINVAISDADSLEINWTAVLIDNATGQRYQLGSGNRATTSQKLISMQKANFADGSYTLEVEAIDKGGNRTFVSNTFTFDTTPPEVRIETGSERFETGTMRLILDIEDMSPISSASLTVNGKAVVGLNAVTRQGLYTFTEPGEYTLVATVGDRAGNIAKVTRVITIAENTDFTPPSVTIHSPSEGVYYNHDVAVRISIGEDQAAYMGWKVRVTHPNTGNVNIVAQGEGPITDEVVYTMPVSYASTNGVYKFEVEAVDAAGNVTIERVNILVDSTNPIISRNNYHEYRMDGAGARHLTEPFSLEWTFSDKGSPEELVTWTVFCKDKETGRTVALKTGTGFGAGISIDPAQFASGRYGFTLQVVDAAGNTATSPEFDTYMDAVPPVLQSLTHEMTGFGFRIFATATDDYAMPTYCKYYIESSPNGNYNGYEWTLVKVPGKENEYYGGLGGIDSPIREGAYVVKVVAVDLCGNYSEPQYLTIEVRYR